MDPTASALTTIALLTGMGAAWLLTLIPSCNDPACVEAHRKHSVASRSEAIEKQHATYHDRLRPQPMCPLCQSVDDERKE